VAKLLGGRAEHAGERAGVVGVNKIGESFELARFLAEVAGGANELREARGASAADGGKREKFFAAEIGDGAFDVGPGSILREDGADDHFEAGAAGPPVLGAVCGKERFVIFFKHRQGLDSGQRMRRFLRTKSGDTFCQAENAVDRLWRAS